MGWEIFLGFLFNLSGAATILCVIAVVGFCISLIIWLMAGDLGEPKGKAFGKKGMVVFLWCLISLPIALVPNMDHIWKIRIGLIKLEMASPDNVNKAVEEIARLGKKLECKYIGGCEKK